MAFLAGTSGCAARLRNPIPRETMLGHPTVTVCGFPATGENAVRWRADSLDRARQARLVESIRKAATQPSTTQPAEPRTYNVLCISGGGADGAFGAGVLNGWTHSGKRPQFNMVTGVSTGALIAPFAFLGCEYDDELKKVYTEIETHDVLSFHFLNILFGDAIADSRPLRRLVKQHINEPLIKKIAEEHRKGRRLRVATCNLDGQYPVIWDLGAIAASDCKERLKLFRQVLIASASIPGVFPPAYIDVEVDHKRYEEMHVDGGTAANIIFTGNVIDLEQARSDANVPRIANWRVHIYVLWNGKACPEPEPVEAQTFWIAARGLSTLTKAHTMGDLMQIYYLAKEQQMAFNYISIPEHFERLPVKTLDVFNKDAMNSLFKEGCAVGLTPDQWPSDPRKEALRDLSPKVAPPGDAGMQPTASARWFP